MRRTSHLLPMAGLTVAVVALTSPSYAQSTSVISGRVVDAKSGAPVSDALVVATSNSLQGEQTVMTDASGHFRLPSLPAGVYNVQILRGGYREFSQSAVTLRSGQTVRMAARLVPEAADVDEVIVGPALIDVSSSSATTSLDKDFMRRVPLAAPSSNGGLQRSFESVAGVAPGATSDSQGTSLAGASSPENSYRIDGMSVGSPVTGTLSSSLSTEFLDEVQVTDSGYLPEFGRSASGAISATLKSGGNDFHGGAWLNYSPTTLTKAAPENPQPGDAVVSQSKAVYRGDVGFDLGGRIVRDRLWFYVGAQFAQDVSHVRNRYVAWRQPDDEDAEITESRNLDGVADSFNTRRTLATALAKLTYRQSADSTISLTGMYLPSLSGARGDALRDDANPAGSPVQRQGKETNHVSDLALRWQVTRNNKRLTFDSTLQWHHESYYRGPRDGKGRDSNSPEATLPQIQWSGEGSRGLSDFIDLTGDNKKRCTSGDDGWFCPVKNYYTGGMGEIVQTTISRVQLRHTTGYTFEALGQHVAKAGIDLEMLTANRLKAKSGDAMLQETGEGWQEFEHAAINTAPNQLQEMPRFRAKVGSYIWGGFLQDQWTIADQLTINGGVRYDGQVIVTLDKPWVSLPWQFGPRLGFVWDPTKQGKAKLFASYARTYQSMPLEMALVNGSSEARFSGVPNGDNCSELMRDKKSKSCLDRSTWGDLDWARLSPNRSGYPENSMPGLVDPKLRPTANDEIFAGVSAQLLSDVSVSLNYRWRRLSQVLEDLSFNDLAGYVISNPGYGVAKGFPKFQRKYDMVSLGLDKAMSKHWMAKASYSVAWLRGNYEGFISGEDVLPGIGSVDLPIQMVNSTGYLGNDHRHQIKAYLAGDVPLGDHISLQGGVSFLAQSGAPTSYLGFHAQKGNGGLFLLPRGSGERLPWMSQLDLSTAVVMVLNSGQQLSLNFQVFNVINLQAPTGRNQDYTLAPKVLPLPKDSTLSDLQKEVKDADKVAADNGDDQVSNNSYGAVTSRQDPISGRIGIRMTF